MAGSSFYDQIAANRRNSFLMAALVVVLLGMLGFAIGWAVFGDPSGGVIALVSHDVPLSAVLRRDAQSSALSWIRMTSVRVPSMSRW